LVIDLLAAFEVFDLLRAGADFLPGAGALDAGVFAVPTIFAFFKGFSDLFNFLRRVHVSI
jgi:hypothetical protein